MNRDDRASLPVNREHVTNDNQYENHLTPYPPYPDYLKRYQRNNIRKEERFSVRTGQSGSGIPTPRNDNRNSSVLSSNTDRATSGPSRTQHACGSPACRVCVALGFLPRPRRAPRGVVAPLPGNQHPLSTEAALARANRVWQAMVDYQLEHGHEPPRLADIATQCGFANAGLMSRYMQRLATQGRVRKVPVKGRGRYGYRWQAVMQ